MYSADPEIFSFDMDTGIPTMPQGSVLFSSCDDATNVAESKTHDQYMVTLDELFSFPGEMHNPYLIGRTGSPPPPEQIPGLSTSYDSVSSSGSFEDSYSEHLARANEPSGVDTLTHDVAKMTVEDGPAELILNFLPELTEIDNFVIDMDAVLGGVDVDTNIVLADLYNYVPTDADRELLNAPYIGFLELPSDDEDEDVYMFDDRD